MQPAALQGGYPYGAAAYPGAVYGGAGGAYPGYDPYGAAAAGGQYMDPYAAAAAQAHQHYAAAAAAGYGGGAAAGYAVGLCRLNRVDP
jgi:hypothetical protein